MILLDLPLSCFINLISCALLKNIIYLIFDDLYFCYRFTDFKKKSFIDYKEELLKLNRSKFMKTYTVNKICESVAKH